MRYALPNGWEALHFAAAAGSLEAVQILIAGGADAKAKLDARWLVRCRQPLAEQSRAQCSAHGLLCSLLGVHGAQRRCSAAPLLLRPYSAAAPLFRTAHVLMPRRVSHWWQPADLARDSALKDFLTAAAAGSLQQPGTPPARNQQRVLAPCLPHGCAAREWIT